MSVIPFDPCDYDEELKIMDAVARIHESLFKAYLVITGGGTELLPMLLKNGDGSKTLTSAFVPYATEDLRDFLDVQEDEPMGKPVSMITAFDMAGQGYVRSSRTNVPKLCVGISMTASLQRIEEERPGRQHEVFIGYRKHKDGRIYHLDLTPSAPHPDFRMRRRMEERICAEAGLWALATACNVLPHRDDLPLVEVQRYPDREFDR